MNSSEIINKLKAAGFVHVRTAGSHHFFRHPDSKRTVVVPHPKKDLPIGTVKAIEKQSGVTFR
nr:MAG TPA: putative RNA-binding protein [Caudoviricetes sp.]